MRKLADLFFTFARIGAFTFGGGYAMLSLLEHECVEKKRWLTADEMAEMAVIAESTPGPIAVNCATYTGVKQGGLPGAVAATLGMALPSFAVLVLISAFLDGLLAIPLVANALRGIRAAVVLLVLRAGVRLLKNALRTTSSRPAAIAIFAAFTAVSLASMLFSWQVPTIALIAVSGLMGIALFGRKEAAE